MIRTRRCLACVLAVALQLAWAQAPADLRSALDDFIDQVGGPTVAREIIEDVASLDPESFSELLSSGPPSAAVLDVARAAGVPELAVAASRDPDATLRALERIVVDPAGAIAALDRAEQDAEQDGAIDDVLAQAPSDAAPRSDEPPPLPGSAPEDRPADDEAPSDEPAQPSEPSSQDPTVLPGSEAADDPDDGTQQTELALDVATWLELGFVVVGWIAVTWLLFFVTWRLFLVGNPFLAVRIAYSISVVAALSYLALVFWPREFHTVLDARYTFVPYVVAGVLALLVIVAIWANYRTETEYD